MIRPNIPPLLMNIEKESEPSITDVFAGQILKNHGITVEATKDNIVLEKKSVVTEVKRPILPIIDPATISSHELDKDTNSEATRTTRTSVSSVGTPMEDPIKEITQIEAKIHGLKQKLADQLDSMSEDDDFLNIRTEAEELMNDFAEDVFQVLNYLTNFLHEVISNELHITDEVCICMFSHLTYFFIIFSGNISISPICNCNTSYLTSKTSNPSSFRLNP